jgi:hypothetical protein
MSDKKVNTTQLTQGRIVRFFDRRVGPARIVWPALVVRVDDGQTCTLHVFHEFAVVGASPSPIRRGVKMDRAGAVEGTWHWPGDLDRIEAAAAAAETKGGAP